MPTNKPSTSPSVLFLRNLPPHVKNVDIENAFVHYDFASVRVIGVQSTVAEGLSVCVEFESAYQADLALSTVNTCPFPNSNPQVFFDLSFTSNFHPNPKETTPLTTPENRQSRQLHRKIVPLPSTRRSLRNSRPISFPHDPADLESERSCYPDHLNNTIPEQTGGSRHVVTESDLTSENAPSGPIRMSMKAVNPLQTELEPITTPTPDITPVGHTKVVHAEETQVSELPGTWCEQKRPPVAEKPSTSLWTNIYNKLYPTRSPPTLDELPAEEMDDPLVYVDPVFAELETVRVEKAELRESLKAEQEKTVKHETVVRELELAYQEKERQLQEKTRNDLKKLDMQYAAHQDSASAKHGKARQKMQAEHEAELDGMTIELERFRTENLGLKQSVDGCTILNQNLVVERDSLQADVTGLRAELDQAELDATKCEAERDHWRQSFADIDAKLEAKEEECHGLQSDLERVSQESEIRKEEAENLRKEVERLRVQESKHKLREMQWKEAEDRRKKLEEERRKKEEQRKEEKRKLREEERKKEEERKLREEEKRKEEERKQQEEEKRQEEERRREEAREKEERRLREEVKRQEEERQRAEKERRLAEAKREQEAKEAAVREEQAHRKAAAAEDERCRKRDAQRWGRKQWTRDMALERFHIVMTEFLPAKYSPLEPVTTRSIPWPTLLKPAAFKFEHVTWENVEEFLKYMKSQEFPADHDAYMKLLKQIQFMFHPDRWSSRNTLQSVMDDELRKTLEAAVRTVSQAVNQWIDQQGGGNKKAH